MPPPSPASELSLHNKAMAGIAIIGMAMRSPAGDVDATLQACGQTKGAGGSLHGELLEHILAVADDACGTTRPDIVLLATTKGAADQWAESLAGSYAGGPVELSRAITSARGWPCQAISAACASGPLAVAEAARLLRADAATSVLVIGADQAGAFVQAGFEALGALDPSGHCQPFAENRAGLQLGDSVAALLLGSPTNQDRTVWLQGWGGSCDAEHLTGPARDGQGLKRAIQACQSKTTARSCIIAHGTGTRANDSSESSAIQASLGQIPVAAWKGSLGHGLGACGVSELVLAAEVIKNHKPLPGSCNTTTPAADCAINLLPAGPHPGPWTQAISINAGFGGLNGAACIGDSAQAFEASHRRASCSNSAYLDSTGMHHRQAQAAWQTQAWSHSCDPGCWPKLSAAAVLGQADTAWGRMDTACRSAVLLAKLLQVNGGPNSAQILGTSCGCAATDRAFEAGRRQGTPSPQLFPYTLPSTPLAEVALRLRIQGPAFCILPATQDELRQAALRLLGEGMQEVVIYQLDCDRPPWHAWGERWLAQDDLHAR